MESESRVEHYKDMMSEDAVPVCGFRLLSFMDENGEIRYKMHQFGDGTASHLIGLLEMAKMEIMMSAKS